MSAGDERPVATRSVNGRDRMVDALIAGILAAATAVTVPLSGSALGAPSPPLAAVVAWAAVIALPLALRRIVPSVVAVVVVVAFIAGQALGIPEALVSQIAPFLALYSLGAWSPHRRRAAILRTVLGALVAVWFVVAVVAVRTQDLGSPAAVALTALSTALYLAAAMIFGEAGWRSALRRAELERRTEDLRRERRRTAEQAVALERIRIARDLHDVLAHHVSVIGVQAGAARRTLATRPDAAEAALAAIETSSRDAVDELRRTVLALRTDAELPGRAVDAPSTLGVDRIPELVNSSADAGVDTELRLHGEASRLCPAASLALYRVAQEALTNVRKHAGSGARAAVTLEIRDDAAELTVIDRGGRGGGEGAGTGVGEIGMRERISSVGGRLETGPTADGYRVRAVVGVAR